MSLGKWTFKRYLNVFHSLLRLDALDTLSDMSDIILASRKPYFFSGLSEDQTDFGKTENLGLTSATHPEKHNHKKMPHFWLLRTQICGCNSAGYTEPWFYQIIRQTLTTQSLIYAALSVYPHLCFSVYTQQFSAVEFMLVILSQPICKQEDERGASLHLKHFIKIFPAEITLWSSLQPRHVHTHCLFLTPPLPRTLLFLISFLFSGMPISVQLLKIYCKSVSQYLGAVKK